MTTPQPPEREAFPDPQDPDYIRAMAVLRAKAERSKAEKDQALQEWCQEETDEDILDEFGLNIDVLREDP